MASSVPSSINSSPSSNDVTTNCAALPTRGKVCVEYVWITRLAGIASSASAVMRSKTRVLDRAPHSVAQLDLWPGDACAYNQGTATERFAYKVEVVLRPVYMCDDPFRGAPHKLALCETIYPDGTALPSNHRARASKIMRSHAREEAWFGIEQEYMLFQSDGRTPFGWPKEGVPAAQVQSLNYCGVGDVAGREVMESHFRACLAAGIAISGVNLEVTVGSCEYQMAPLSGLDAADQLWMSRYILARICERYSVHLSFDPKPLPDADGCGLHTNVSTKGTRSANGMEVIEQHMDKFKAHHADHLAVYGQGNERRLKGEAEYSRLDQFSYGVGDRGASIRIPAHIAREGKGYYEDRRPAANADPYFVVARIMATIVDEEL